MDAKRTAVYCRISDDRTGAGLGVERQEKECKELAERLGWEVVEVYSDNDISAYSGKPRPGYRNMIADLQAGKVDAVITWHTDRLHRKGGRGLQELEDYIDLCESRRIPTHTVKAGVLDLSTASGRMNARIQAAVARHETEHNIERLRSARVQKVGRGEWVGGRRPFGYEADGVTVNQAEADALRWAASHVLAGMSLNAIVAKLNGQGIRTSTGKPWKPTELRRALVRPRNAGLIQHRTCGQKQEPGKHHHTEKCSEIVGRAEWPAILDEDTWRGVCATLSDPARRTNTTTARKYLLAGLARCGVCGDPVRSFSASAKRRPVRPVYTCRTGKHVIRTAEEVDRFVEEVVVGILTKRGAELLAPDQTGDTSALHLRDAALRARLDELGRLAGEGVIDAGQLVQATTAIRTQREQITAQLAAMSRGSVLAGVADAADPAKVWTGLDLSRKRAVVDVLMTVTILPAKRGRRPGWRPGDSYFDPDTVRIEPKR